MNIQHLVYMWNITCIRCIQIVKCFTWSLFLDGRFEVLPASAAAFSVRPAASAAAVLPVAASPARPAREVDTHEDIVVTWN